MDSHTPVSGSGTDGNSILKQIVEIIPFYVFWKDLNCNYLGCNKIFAESAGLENSEAIRGKSDHDLAWDPEEADFYRKCDHDVMEHDYVLLDIEETQRKADGTKMTIRTSKIPLHDSTGKVSGLLGVFSDITETKHKDERFHLQNTALNASSEGILISDLNGYLTWSNPAAQRMTGYPANELHGHSLDILINGEQNQDLYARVLQSISEGHVWQGEIEGSHRNGHQFIVHLTITPVRNEKGDLSHYVANAVDLTEKKKLEAQIEHLKNT